MAADFEEIKNSNRPFVLYDGVCVFCNTTVDFILENERNDQLMFTPLQSDLGKSILKRFGYPENYLGSILYLENGHLLQKSSAALAISRFLKAPISWLYVFRFIPRPIRDAIYNYVAKNRYSWFGKYDACRIPTADLKKRFYA